MATIDDYKSLYSNVGARQTPSVTAQTSAASAASNPYVNPRTPAATTPAATPTVPAGGEAYRYSYSAGNSKPAAATTPASAVVDNYRDYLSRIGVPTPSSYTANEAAKTTATPAATPRVSTPSVATPNVSPVNVATPTAQTPSATSATATEPVTPAAETEPVEETPKQPSFAEQYNANREQRIRDLYAQNLQSVQQGLKTAYDSNLNNAEFTKSTIAPQYQQSSNQLAAEYERMRRNNNMQAATNGINTGVGSQMQLSQSNAYLTNQAGLKAKENQALNSINNQILNLKTTYENQIAQAAADNNYKLAAAMLDEYDNQYNRMMSQAQNLAQYGDFSGYNELYGTDAAGNMERGWAMNNPYAAWATGRISAEDFYALTGKMPNDPNAVAAQFQNGKDGTYGGLIRDEEGNIVGNSGAAGTPLGNYYSGYIGGYSGSSGGSRSSGKGASSSSPTIYHTYSEYRAANPNASYDDYMTYNTNALKDAGYINRAYNGSGSSGYYSRSSGRGYSSSRDTAYRGEPGYYDNNGNFRSQADGRIIDYSPQVSNSQRDYSPSVYAGATGGSNSGSSGGSNNTNNSNSGGGGNTWTKSDSGGSSGDKGVVATWINNLVGKEIF